MDTLLNAFNNLNVNGLLGDGWFYISAGGLLVSGILFFFLRGQHRAASGLDQPEPAAEAKVSPVHPAPMGDAVPALVVSVTAEAAQKSTGVVESKPSLQPAQGSLAAADVTPQITRLQQSMTLQFGEMSKRMDELAKTMAELKTTMSAASVREPAPEPNPQLTQPPPAAEPLETKAAAAEEKLAPQPEAAPAAEPTPAQIKPEPQPEPVAAASAPEPVPAEKPRRGPVWPV